MKYLYLILVVNYKKNILESETIKSLSKIPHLNINSKLLVWDNKPMQENHQDIYKIKDRFNQLEYIPCESNERLSSVYNYVIKNKIECFEYLIILDNDSMITTDFFSTLDKSITNNNNIDLFLPIVKSSGLIVSPARLFYFKGIYYKKIKYGKVNAHFKTAINSGMVISSNYLKYHFEGYDEELSLYGIDDYFMKEYSKKNKYFYIIKYVIEHSLSIHVNESVDIKLFRFKNLKNGIRIVNKNSNFILKKIIEIYLLFCSLKESLKYKDMRFFRN